MVSAIVQLSFFIMVTKQAHITTLLLLIRDDDDEERKSSHDEKVFHRDETLNVEISSFERKVYESVVLCHHALSSHHRGLTFATYFNHI